MGYYCITTLWLILTILLTICILISMLSPVWFELSLKITTTTTTTILTKQQHINDDTQLLTNTSIITFGILRYCRLYEKNTNLLLNCKFYNGFSSMPSIAWIISVLIYSIGAGLLMTSLFLSIFGICIKSIYQNNRLRIAVAFLQVIAVGLLSISVLMFPLGLDSKFARDVCGNTKMFSAGNCRVAWGYVLGIMAISLTIFLPILAKYSTESKEDYEEYEGDEIGESCSFIVKEKSDFGSLESQDKVMTTV